MKLDERERKAKEALSTGKTDRALSLVSDLYKDHPDHPHILAIELRAFMAMGRLPEASARINAVPKTSFRGPAIPAMAEVFLKTNQPGAGLAIIESLPERAQGSAPTLMAISKLQEAVGDIDLAIDTLRRAAENYPAQAAVLTRLAVLLIRTGQLAEAEAQLTRGRGFKKRVPDALFITLGRLQIAKFAFDLAEETLSAIDHQSDKYVSALWLRAHAAEQQRGFDRALALAEEGLARQPSHVALNALKWRCLAFSHTPDTAVRLCSEYLQNANLGKEALLAVSEFFRSQELWDQALEVLDRAEKLEPNSVEIPLQRAHCLYSQQDILGAMAALLPVTFSRPNLAAAKFEQSRCLAALGDFKGAMRELHPLLEATIPPIRALLNSAEYALRLGKLDLAHAFLQQAPELAPRDLARLQNLKAEIALAEGDPVRALDRIRAACETDPFTPVYRERLSEILLMNGKVDASLDAHKAFLAMSSAMDIRQAKSEKLNTTLHGHLLNDFRLLLSDIDADSLTQATTQADSLKTFRSIIESEPGNTPAALMMFNILRRQGAISSKPPKNLLADVAIPRQIFQFWDRPDPPEQVKWLRQENMARAKGFDYRVFDVISGAKYLTEKSETAALKAFRLAPHAAGKADILRLALLWHEGGLYLDADDRIMSPLDEILRPGLRFIGYQEPPLSIGNNFMGALPGDPIIRAALDDAVEAFSGPTGESLWLATGPGAVTRALARVGTDGKGQLLDGIWILPQTDLTNWVACHVQLNYKSTAGHWVKQMQTPLGTPR